MSSRHGRERQIAEILTRRGMTYLVGVLGLERLVSWERGLLHRDPKKEFPAPPEDLRLALEELVAHVHQDRSTAATDVGPSPDLGSGLWLRAAWARTPAGGGSSRP